MARGNGKQAQEAMRSGKLSDFVKGGDNGEKAKSNAEYVDYAELDPDVLVAAVVAVNKLSGSILYGHTRDKTSYSCVLFYNGEKKSYYFPCTADGLANYDAFLVSLIDAERYSGE